MKNTSNQQLANQIRQEKAEQLWESRRQEILFLYFTQDLSQQQIAKHYGISQSAISQIFRRMGIIAQGRGRRQGVTHYLYKDGSHNRLYRTLISKDKCHRCGTLHQLGIHHKNDDHYDNRVENLEVLCHPCHMSITKKAWWDAKKAGLPTPKGNGPVGWRRKPLAPKQ